MRLRTWILCVAILSALNVNSIAKEYEIKPIHNSTRVLLHPGCGYPPNGRDHPITIFVSTYASLKQTITSFPTPISLPKAYSTPTLLRPFSHSSKKSRVFVYHQNGLVELHHGRWLPMSQYYIKRWQRWQRWQRWGSGNCFGNR